MRQLNQGMRYAAWISLLAALLIPSWALGLEILPLEDHRYLESVGYIADIEYPSAPFADFDANIGQVIGEVSQNSTIGSLSLSGRGDLIVDGGGGAGGTSFFEILFSVDEAAAYSLAGSIYSEYFSYGAEDYFETPELRDVMLADVVTPEAPIFESRGYRTLSVH